MDNEKKKKIVAIVLSTLISLIVSIAACLLNIPAEQLGGCDGADTAPQATVLFEDTLT